MDQVELDPQVVATLVALPLIAAHVASRLQEMASNLTELAHNLEKFTAEACVGTFPDRADPLAAIHSERGLSAFVSQETAEAIRTVGAGLHLANMYADLEIIDFAIGEEEMLQAISLLRSVGTEPTPPSLTVVTTGPLTAA